MGTIANTTIQAVTPAHLRGRVMRVSLLVSSGGRPLGNLFAGGLAGLFGAPISLLLGGILSLIATLAGWIGRRPAAQSLAASFPLKRTERVSSPTVGEEEKGHSYV